MNASRSFALRSNPFSTRFIRPGAIDYRFAPGEDADVLVARLAEFCWRGQIVGPHGSGKSTLLATLAEPLARAGRRLWTIGLHDGARRLPAGWVVRATRAAANLIVVDGYEQLSAWSRLTLQARCRRRGWGLLVSAHRDVGLPTLKVASPKLETAQRVVAHLVSGHDAHLAPELVAACFASSGGNLRETLFALYDRWEALP